MPGLPDLGVPELFVLGQAANAPATGPESFLGPLMMFLPIIFLFYFMILRPQQQQERKRRALIAALKKNDRVLLASGIYGTVESIDQDDDRMMVRVASNVKLEVTRSSVARVLEQGKEPAAEAGKTS
jgi:preprotein translocase subunit YajC